MYGRISILEVIFVSSKRMMMLYGNQQAKNTKASSKSITATLRRSLTSLVPYCYNKRVGVSFMRIVPFSKM